MDLLAPGKFLPVIIVVVVFLFGISPIIFGARVLAAESTVQAPYIDVHCTSSGQLCEPAYNYTFQTGSVLKVNYTVGDFHCSPGKFHFFVDNVEKYVTDWLGWPNAPAPYNTLPLNTGTLDIGPVTSGTHTLGVKAEGKVAGCNVGKIASWQGILFVTTSPLPTPTFTPTPTIPATKLNLNLFLHGIGKAGDSVKQGEAGGGNMSPTHPNRVVRVELYNSQNTKVKSVETTVNFDPNSGSFKGVADVSSVSAGNHLIRAKFSQSLDTQIGGIQLITPQTTHNLPAQYFVTGDVNNDGAVSLNVLDFNLIIGCVGGNSCSAEQKIQSDLDDNGRVDVFDFNLFIREITQIQ